MIEKERIEHIKTGVDLKALAEAKGIRLKKNGNGWFGLCPFHNDTNPSLSMNPSTNLWQCFGCGKGGDVIRFVELFDQVDFKEAVKRLANRNHDEKTSPSTSGLSGKNRLQTRNVRQPGSILNVWLPYTKTILPKRIIASLSRFPHLFFFNRLKQPAQKNI